jgi:ectoine hydroxylase-related dioxygenase (phytanoyl-CoA dioxygenase family)
VDGSLTPDQVERYWEDGVLFPLPALRADETAYFRGRFEELEAALGGRVPKLGIVQPQLHFRWAYDLALNPRIVRAVVDVLGPDVLVQSTSVFSKHPGDQQYVAWHQDGYYWHLSAPRLVSAWVALSPSTPQSGCLRVVVGSHRSPLPHREEPSEGHMLSSGLTLEDDIDPGRIVDVCLRPGEMSFHHERAVHGSNANRGDDKRIGFAIRYLAADVTQELPHHEVLIAAGRARSDHYRIVSEPPTDDLAEGLRRQTEFTKEHMQRRLAASKRISAG